MYVNILHKPVAETDCKNSTLDQYVNLKISTLELSQVLPTLVLLRRTLALYVYAPLKPMGLVGKYLY